MQISIEPDSIHFSRQPQMLIAKGANAVPNPSSTNRNASRNRKAGQLSDGNEVFVQGKLELNPHI